jgi:hypothetical protein
MFFCGGLYVVLRPTPEITNSTIFASSCLFADPLRSPSTLHFYFPLHEADQVAVLMTPGSVSLPLTTLLSQYAAFLFHTISFSFWIKSNASTYTCR